MLCVHARTALRTRLSRYIAGHGGGSRQAFLGSYAGSSLGYPCPDEVTSSSCHSKLSHRRSGLTMELFPTHRQYGLPQGQKAGGDGQQQTGLGTSLAVTITY